MNIYNKVLNSVKKIIQFINNFQAIIKFKTIKISIKVINLKKINTDLLKNLVQKLNYQKKNKNKQLIQIYKF